MRMVTRVRLVVIGWLLIYGAGLAFLAIHSHDRLTPARQSLDWAIPSCVAAIMIGLVLIAASRFSGARVDDQVDDR